MTDFKPEPGTSYIVKLPTMVQFYLVVHWYQATADCKDFISFSGADLSHDARNEARRVHPETTKEITWENLSSWLLAGGSALASSSACCSASTRTPGKGKLGRHGRRGS